MEVPGSVTWFGRYRLSARIATGGMAEVYLGRKQEPNGRFGPSVAVKRLLPHLISETGVVRMFLNEARITAQINHPNVVRILDLGQEGKEPFIAMELLEGRSLADLRQAAAEAGQRVPIGIVLRILSEACRGLDAAHRAVDEDGHQLQIVHRDFSPDNIHVGVDGSIKVIDFGIATASNVSSGTEPGTLKGKFFYMSPEMISGAPLDHRADLFAAGVMLYEQLCGRRPFTGLTTDEVLSRIAEGKPKKPSSFDPSVPPVLELICLTALSHNPQARFPSLKEFITALESVGGIAQIATPEEVGAYVNALFPEARDPQRRLLREARKRDPSMPAATNVGGVTEEEPGSDPPRAADTVPEPSPTANPSGEPAPADPSVDPSERITDKPTKQAPQSSASSVPAPALPAWLYALGGALAAILLGGGLLLWHPWNRAAATVPNAADYRRDIQAKLDAKANDAALDLAHRYEAAFPRDVQAPLLEARVYMALRQGKKADAALDHAASLSPEDPAPELVRAELRQMQGDLPGVLDALAAAQKKAPNSRDIQRRRALLLSQANKLDEAAAALGALLQKKYEADLGAELGFVKLRQATDDDKEGVKEAIAQFRKALKRKPKLSIAHYYLGTALARQGDAAGAEHEYREAAEDSPTDPRPLSALCQVQAHDGREKEAAATKELLVTRFPAQAAQLTAECHP